MNSSRGRVNSSRGRKKTSLWPMSWRGRGTRRRSSRLRRRAGQQAEWSLSPCNTRDRERGRLSPRGRSAWCRGGPFSIRRRGTSRRSRMRARRREPSGELACQTDLLGQARPVSTDRRRVVQDHFTRVSRRASAAGPSDIPQSSPLRTVARRASGHRPAPLPDWQIPNITPADSANPQTPASAGHSLFISQTVYVVHGLEEQVVPNFRT